MEKKKVLFAAFAGVFVIGLLLLVMCDGGSKKPAQQTVNRSTLEKDYSTGVCLIYNLTWYSITFNNQVTCYFSGVDEEGNVVGFTTDEEEVLPDEGWGTGFFISNDGKIVTNCHVAAEQIDESHVRSLIVNSLADETDEYKAQINQLNETIATLNVVYLSNGDSKTGKRIEELQQQRDELQKIVNMVDRLNTATYTVNVKSLNFAAYHNTHVKTTQDMHTCELLDVDVEHDLALLQLSDKKTPNDRYVFTCDTTNLISTEDPLYLIGYNTGPVLGATSTGIKAQVTEGKKSQDRGENFVHTIICAEGSSGSPILNQYGKVVGVNFAHLASASEFKFGVKVKFVKQLLDKNK